MKQIMFKMSVFNYNFYYYLVWLNNGEYLLYDLIDLTIDYR